MFTLFNLGIVIIVLTVLGCGLLLYFRERGFGAIVGLGFVGLFAGVLVTVLPSVQRIVVSAGQGKNLEFDLGEAISAVQTKATEVERIDKELHALEGHVQKSESSVTEMRNAVQSDVNEIKDLKGQITTLAQSVQQSQGSITQTEQNLLQIQAATKQAMRALIEMFYYEVSTRNYLGTIPKPILDQMNARLLVLEQLSYNSPEDVAAAFQEMKRVIDEVQHPQTPTRTPPATPVP